MKSWLFLTALFYIVFYLGGLSIGSTVKFVRWQELIGAILIFFGIVILCHRFYRLGVRSGEQGVFEMLDQRDSIREGKDMTIDSDSESEENPTEDVFNVKNY